jgi:hypothetical protein
MKFIILMSFLMFSCNASVKEIEVSAEKKEQINKPSYSVNSTKVSGLSYCETILPDTLDNFVLFFPGVVAPAPVTLDSVYSFLGDVSCYQLSTNYKGQYVSTENGFTWNQEKTNSEVKTAKRSIIRANGANDDDMVIASNDNGSALLALHRVGGRVAVNFDYVNKSATVFNRKTKLNDCGGDVSESIVAINTYQLTDEDVASIKSNIAAEKEKFLTNEDELSIEEVSNCSDGLVVISGGLIDTALTKKTIENINVFNIKPFYKTITNTELGLTIEEATALIENNFSLDVCNGADCYSINWIKSTYRLKVEKSGTESLNGSSWSYQTLANWGMDYQGKLQLNNLYSTWQNSQTNHSITFTGNIAITTKVAKNETGIASQNCPVTSSLTVNYASLAELNNLSCSYTETRARFISATPSYGVSCSNSSNIQNQTRSCNALGCGNWSGTATDTQCVSENTSASSTDINGNVTILSTRKTYYFINENNTAQAGRAFGDGPAEIVSNAITNPAAEDLDETYKYYTNSFSGLRAAPLSNNVRYIGGVKRYEEFVNQYGSPSCSPDGYQNVTFNADGSIFGFVSCD